jgi:hypothetical protein
MRTERTRIEEVGSREMGADRRSAVLTGVFYIIGTVTGAAGLVAVLGPVRSAPDYLRAYGTMETRVLIASLLYLLMGVSLVAMAAAVYPVLKRFNPAAAIAYFGARVLEAVTYIFTVISMLLLVELGTQYVASGAADATGFQTLGSLLLRVTERAVPSVLVVAIFPLGALVLNSVFFRTRLVPRWLSVWGLIGAVLYWIAGALVMFQVIASLGTQDVMLQALLGLQEMVLAIWLIAKGFDRTALASGAESQA